MASFRDDNDENIVQISPKLENKNSVETLVKHSLDQGVIDTHPPDTLVSSNDRLSILRYD